VLQFLSEFFFGNNLLYTTLKDTELFLDGRE